MADKEKDPGSLSPQEAWQMMESDPRTTLIDIRSTMEYLFVGHPKGAVHIAWIDEPDWIVDPQFVRHVRELMLGGLVCDEAEGCAKIILICRSGKRSKEAGRALLDAGLTSIYHVDEGFEGDLDQEHHRSTTGGWRFHDLPWEQC